MSMMTTTKTGQRLSWLLLSTLLTTAVSANGNNNNYHSNLLASSSSPSTSSLYSSSSSSSSSPSSSSSSNPGSYYSFPLNIVEAAKVYQSRSSGYSSPAIVNFLQQYQQQQQQQSESLASAVRRSQQDVASLYNQPETINLSPAMQQLASSLLAASAQSVASFESPPSAAAASVDGQQNYSAGLLDAGNAAAIAESAFYSNPSLYNYFLNAQQYYPSDPSAAYTLSPAALEQYTAAFLQAGNGSALGGKHSSVGVVGSQNNKATQMTGVNKQGLGRRIGELVSNSAERASRAFKSFSQFKLFNDIKPSRLLGLVSDQQQQQQSGDGKMLVNSSTASMVASASSPPSAWYFPPSGQVAAGIPVANPWSSAAYGSSQAAPPASPSFYQQPVYVRTQDVGGGGQVAAAAAALAAQKGADYLASMSELYPQKLSALDGTGAAPFAPSPPNANIALSGSTTVYHHYGPSSLNGGGGRGGGGNEGGNSQHSDLFAAPQTTFGVRMKPPKDFEFDSNEDELSNSSSEQDDAKMADNGGGGSNGGRNNMDNGGNDGSSSGDRFNERPSNGGGSGNGGGNSGPWSSGSSSFDEFSESNSGVEPDLYNAYNPNVPNNGQRFRPFNTGHSGFRPVIAPNAFQASMPNLRPYMAGIRRPTPMAADFDDSDSWYSTFFGNNIKPMTRLRGVPFANNAPMAAAAAAAFANAQHHQSAAHHHQPHPSLLNSAASTQTPTSLSPDNYFGSAAGAHHHAHHHSPHANYFQAAFNRPVWPGYSTALYPGAASPYFRPNPLLTGAATQMRPVTMPYSPYFMAPRYHHHQAPRPAMYGHAAYPTASPMMMAAARYPTAMSPYSMMPSASTLYPVRVPFSPMMPMANPFAAMAASSLIPTIAQPPIMRYRIGTDLTPSPVSSSSSSSSSPAVSTIRRTLNITKRGNLAGGSSTGNGLDLVDTASSVLSKVGKAIANKLPSVKLSSLSMSGAAAKNEDGAEIIVPNEHEASLATLYNAYQVLQRRMETTEHTQAPSTSSPSENASSRSSQQQQQQQQSAQPPPPYYHYYIGDKDTYQSTSTTTSTTSTSTSSPLSTVLNSFQDNSGLGFSTEHLDSSARAIPLNFTASSSSSTGARSIKARHVSEQLAEHEKRQQEIRQFLEGGAEVGVQLTATNGTSTDIPSPTYITPSTTTSSPVITRTAKAVSSGSSGSPQILYAGDNSPWRPLLRSAVVGRKRY